MIEVEVNTQKLEKAIRMIPHHLKMELGDAFDYLGKKLLKTFKQTRLQGPPGIKGRTHGIFKRFKRVMLVPTSGIDSMGTIIFTESKIARLHEEGGVIEGNLKVPLSARTEMFTAGGYGKGTLKRKYKAPSRLKNIRLVVLRGKRFLAKFKRGDESEITPLYVLKNRIKIRPRLGFYKTWENMENLRLNRLNKAVHKALQKV